MAIQDNIDYLYYKSQGGKLSFDEWMKEGKPPASGVVPGTPTIPSTPTSPNVTGSVTPTQPPAPTYNPPPPDPYESDIAAAEKAAAEAAEKEAAEKKAKAAAEADFTNPTKLPSIPPPVGFHWNWDGFRWQPEKDKEGTTVDPELGNAKKMPSTPPPIGFHWEWRGDRWHPVKDEPTATPVRPKKSRQPGAPDKYWDAYGREWTWDDYEGYQETGYDKTKDTRLTEKEPKDTGFPQPPGEVPTDPYGRKATWDADDGEWRYPPDWGEDPEAGAKQAAKEAKEAADRAAKEAEDKRRFEIEQTFRQQQATQSSDQFWRQFEYQAAQEAARRQAEKEARLANLRASPASWLQYSLEANQTPVIQPWQKPLMPQQYGNLNVGQPIPGWKGLNQGSANLPELTTPSTQYFARIGPTAQQQWGGYQQMQSGAPVEESMFRLQAQSAPGGRNRGLSWLR